MNDFGYFQGETMTVTYQMGDSTPLSSLHTGEASPSDKGFIPSALPIGNYRVWPCGQKNLDFNECKNLIKGNRLLPSLIEKQVRILYGNGPMLYQSIQEKDGKVRRQYLHNEKIQSWLDSWRENGIQDSYETYLNKCVRSFYYSEGIFSKWRISVGYRAGVARNLPVTGLEYVSELRCRMATRKNLGQRIDVEDKDFDFVMVGNWEGGNIRNEYKVYPRMDFSSPLKYNSAISYSKNPNYGEEIYATNVFFAGIKQWLHGCNATPEYINSFLENSLSARHHVIIPNEWFRLKEQQLKNICDANAKMQAQGKPESEYIKVKIGDKEISVGTIYNDSLLSQVLEQELKSLTEFLSGRGKNQGKIYSTRSYINGSGDTETWKIEEIPQKYKEYIESLIAYDKRADMVILSAASIDSSISNVSSDGVISKSGADTFYNYIVYLQQQHLPEDIITADINYALRLNFPEEYRQGIRIGFYRPTPERQEDVTPGKRMSNQIEQ